jgi:hypothetical protein
VGPAGIGKTTLLARLRDEARTTDFKDFCLTALVEEWQGSPADLMARCAAQLRMADAPLAAFEQVLAHYKQATKPRREEQAIARAAFLRDDLAAFHMLPEAERTSHYRWLIDLPFVQHSTLDGRHRYHDLAQQVMRRVLVQHAPQEEQAARRADPFIPASRCAIRGFIDGRQIIVVQEVAKIDQNDFPVEARVGTPMREAYNFIK